MKKLFKIGNELPARQRLLIEIAGFIALIFLWWLITHPFKNPRIEFNAINGTAPFTYQWSGPDNYEQTGDKAGIIKNLKDGTYTLKITDSNSQSISAQIEITPNDHEITVIEQPQSNEELGLRMDATYEKAWITKGILPAPFAVLGSYKGLLSDKVDVKVGENKSIKISSLLYNSGYSITLNILGYLEAILISIIVGFSIALVPFFRGLLSRYIDAIRFVPLAAVTGLFIAWFGIELNMKVQFLAFGIFVFLLPVVVQRIDEVDKVYKQTAFTLGATDWQTIRYVYWPHVISKLIDDIRVLTAISWTYIIVAELVNKESGLGALIFTARRHSRLDQVFALLLLIILIGFIQDVIFVKLDKKINPHKYA